MSAGELIESAIPFGTDRPLAEWTVAEYGAALEAAGVREELARLGEERHAQAMRVVALLRPR
jgi:hypothetical protein